MTPEERATQFWKDLEVGMKAASHLLLDLIQDTRSAAFEEAAKMVENTAYVEYQAGAKAPSQESVRGILSQAASAIRQHAKGGQNDSAADLPENSSK